MKVSPIAASLLLAIPASAIPNPFHLSGNPLDLASQAVESAQTWMHDAFTQAKIKLESAHEVMRFGQLKTEMLSMNGIEYESLTHPAFPLHRLRVVEPELCDRDVYQLSGYLDIADNKHLFFWFEESRHKPKSDPLVLWLNGGPGCSSTTGHLFELGGCNIADEGQNTTYNPFSWNSVANVLFLDQPVGVGYSYSENGEVNNSPAAADDVYAFLILFISKFTKYAKQDFHISGESYAGTYLPNIANVIYKHNLALELAPSGLPQLNFKSVMIGDGLTDPYYQFASVPDFACDSDYAVYPDPEGPECLALRAKVPRCQQLISSCYKTGSRFACTPAALYCWNAMFKDLQELGLNLYDVRRTCDRSPDKDGQLCYREMGWMETYLNKPEIKQQLGVPAEVKFESCNMQINQAFLLQGDGMHNAGALLPELVDSGIRLLLYAGDADMIVNSIGVSRVLDNLPTSYSNDYTKAKVNKFKSDNGTVAGWVKSAGKGAGNVAMVSFKNAGHMVPHDDPPAALTMFSKWLKNEPLA